MRKKPTGDPILNLLQDAKIAYEKFRTDEPNGCFTEEHLHAGFKTELDRLIRFAKIDQPMAESLHLRLRKAFQMV